MRPSKMSTSIWGISPASSCHQPQDPRFWVCVSHSPICQVGIAHVKGCGTKAEKGNIWSQEAAAWHHATRSWSAGPGAIPQHCHTAAPSPTNLIPHQINDSLTEPRTLFSLLLSLPTVFPSNLVRLLCSTTSLPRRFHTSFSTADLLPPIDEPFQLSATLVLFPSTSLTSKRGAIPSPLNKD